MSHPHFEAAWSKTLAARPGLVLSKSEAAQFIAHFLSVAGNNDESRALRILYDVHFVFEKVLAKNTHIDMSPTDAAELVANYIEAQFPDSATELRVSVTDE